MCRHEPSMRDLDIPPVNLGPFATATGHSCIHCDALVYRVHSRPNLKQVARYNAVMSAIPASVVKDLSKTEKRNHTLDLLRTLPHGERSRQRVRPDEVAA